MKKVLLIGDSFGVERIHNNVLEVPLEQTYPELLKEFYKENNQWEINTSNLKYRKFIELPELLSYQECDICVVQLGIVDVYPRPLSQDITMSKSKWVIALKKISRRYRPFILKYLYNKPWSSHQQIKSVLDWCKKQDKKFLFIGCTTLSEEQALNSPGAIKSLKRFNELLDSESKGVDSFQYIDVFNPVAESNHPLEFIHPSDSHLTVQGNQLYYELIKTELLKIS